MPPENNPGHSPQVGSRSLQSNVLPPSMRGGNQPWSSLTRSPPELPPGHPTLQQPSYGSTPGVDRGVQSSLLSLASDPCTKRKVGSLRNNNHGEFELLISEENFVLSDQENCEVAFIAKVVVWVSNNCI